MILKETEVTAHRSVFYVALMPNGRMYAQSRDPEIVQDAVKFWRGPGELSFEEVTSVVYREPLQYKKLTKKALKGLVDDYDHEGEPK